jgi:hypothetical protein
VLPSEDFAEAHKSSFAVGNDTLGSPG